MATPQVMSASRVATQRDIDESQELQDRGIRKEFRTVHQKLDAMDDRIHDRFSGVYAYMDQQFREQRAYVDDRFQQVDDRFQQVDDRFRQVDDRLLNLEVLMKNSKATSSWDDIFPVRVYDPRAEPRDQYRTSSRFPNKVVKFWRLQQPRNQPQLVELLRFYNIRVSDLAPEAFGDDDDTDTESKSSFKSSSTLERVTLGEVVKANPALALARLAAQLGLDYHSIHHNVGLAEQLRRVKADQEALRVKRERSNEEEKDKDSVRSAKRAAISEVIQAHRTTTGIPLEVLLACPDEFQSESPSAHTRLGWGTPPDARRPLSVRAPASPSRKAASPPAQSPPGVQPLQRDSPSSKGDTILFTPTPSMGKGTKKDNA